MSSEIQAVVFIILLFSIMRMIKGIAENRSNEEFELFLKNTGQTKEEYRRKIKEELE